MTHWILLAAPLVVASFVMLFAFVGCFLDSVGEGGPPDEEPLDYKTAVSEHRDIVAWWHLNEEPGDPTAHEDISGLNGTYVGNVQLGQTGLVVAMSDQAAQFDGSTAYVDLPFVLDASGPFSIECWVRPQVVDGQPTIIAQRDGTGTGRTLLFIADSGNFASNLGGAIRDSGFTAAVDTTHYVVFTYAGGVDGAWVFYVDGFETATGTATGESATDGWLIGVNKTLAANFWTGTIDEVAVYDAPLDATTVEQHFTLGSMVLTP